MIVLFEDEGYKELRPISEMNAVSTIILGAFSQEKRIERAFKEKPALLLREYLVKKYSELGYDVKPIADEKVIFINSRLIVTSEADSILSMGEGEAFLKRGRVIAACLPKKSANEAIESYSPEKINEILLKNSVKRREIEANTIEHPWDVISKGLKLLKEDLMGISKSRVPDEVKIIGHNNVFLDEEAEIQGPVTIDTREGPVLIEKAEIESFSYLAGPLIVKKGSKIFSGARVDSSYIGEVTRVGGEVSSSFIMPFSNKRHFGFLGHSYVCSWTNIGAGAVTSNLKNTYGEIRKKTSSGVLPTGMEKLGSFFGQHSKISIGTMLLSATYVGTASHAVGFISEDIPPFVIYRSHEVADELEISSAIRTYERMASRRNVEPSKGEIEALKALFDMTSEERVKFLKSKPGGGFEPP
ncbi:MAG: hypothetical protein C0200_03365 [Thermoproteota archaeon]|nr:MAG: hypothetical protein C0200_03365 [Candidatus Korarchaeota archaeon]